MPIHSECCVTQQDPLHGLGRHNRNGTKYKSLQVNSKRPTTEISTAIQHTVYEMVWGEKKKKRAQDNSRNRSHGLGNGC